MLLKCSEVVLPMCNEIMVRIDAWSVSDRNQHEAIASKWEQCCLKVRERVEASSVCQQKRFSEELVHMLTEG